MKINSGFSQFLILLKLSLKNSFSLSHFKANYIQNKKRLWEPIVIAVALIPTAAFLVYGYISLLSATFDQMAPLGQSHIILTFAIAISSILVLFFGIFWIISTFYFSKDLEKLVPLPVSSTALLMSRLASVVINEYLTLAITFLPAILVYGIKSGGGVGYYLISIVIFLLLPIIPLAIASLVALFIMRFVNLKKFKTVLTFVGVTAFLAAYFWFQYSITKVPIDADASIFLQMLFVAQDGIVRMISKIFPPSLWATFSITLSFFWDGLLNFLKFFGLTTGMVILVGIVGRKLFNVSLQGGQQEDSGRKKAVEYKSGDAILSPAIDAKRAIAKRDLRVFLRNTVFLLNQGMSAIIFPGLLLVYSMGSMGDIQGIQEFAVYLTAPQFAAYRILIMSACIIIITAMSGVASTSFSREGMDFSVSKIIPMSAVDQVKGKLRFCNIVCSILGLPALVVLQYIVRVNVVELLLVVLLSFVAIVAVNSLGLFFDLRKPLLKWENPQRAVKNNMNLMIAMGIFMLILILIGAIDVLLMLNGMSANMLYVVTLLLMALVAFGFYRIVIGASDKLFRRIEL